MNSKRTADGFYSPTATLLSFHQRKKRRRFSPVESGEVCSGVDLFDRSPPPLAGERHGLAVGASAQVDDGGHGDLDDAAAGEEVKVSGLQRKDVMKWLCLLRCFWD